MDELLHIKDLIIKIKSDEGSRELIKGLNLKVGSQKVVALVGGSGSGKTTAGLAILRLLSDSMDVQGGEILFEGKDLLKASIGDMRRLRGKDIAMVFQEPLSAFNPVFTIGGQINEVLKYHTRLNRRQLQERLHELLELVGLPEPKRVLRSYPHQLSGGMRQRAMIAQAIVANPKLIIADEPTSNLDVTLQAQMIDLFRKLRNDLKISMVLITHDLGIVRELADEVAVLFDGRVVECGPAREVLSEPRHAYTSELTKIL